MIEGQRGKVVIKNPIHFDKLGCYTHNEIANINCLDRHIQMQYVLIVGLHPILM
jgi:hypothetical protein